MQLRLVLDGQRRELNVGREVAGNADRPQQPEGDVEVPRSWLILRTQISSM